MCFIHRIAGTHLAPRTVGSSYFVRVKGLEKAHIPVPRELRIVFQLRGGIRFQISIADSTTCQ